MSLDSNNINLDKLNKEIIPFFTRNLEYFREKYSQKQVHCQSYYIVADTESLEKLVDELSEFNKLAAGFKEILLKKMQETTGKIQETKKEKSGQCKKTKFDKYHGIGFLFSMVTDAP